MHDRPTFIAFISVSPLIGWGALSLYYSPLSIPLSANLTAGFVLASPAVFFFARTWKKALAIFAMLFATVLVAFLLKKPSNDRSWQPDLALLPYATIEGRNITLHNILNCDYRTEIDFTCNITTKIEQQGTTM